MLLKVNEAFAALFRRLLRRVPRMTAPRLSSPVGPANHEKRARFRYPPLLSALRWSFGIQLVPQPMEEHVDHEDTAEQSKRR